MHYVQYRKDTGAITGTVSSGRAPVMLPEMPIAQLEFEEWPGDTHHMRVNLETKQLEPCPEIAKRVAISEIDAKLAALDGKTARALREFHIKGDASALENIENQAESLRAERALLTKG